MDTNKKRKMNSDVSQSEKRSKTDDLKRKAETSHKSYTKDLIQQYQLKLQNLGLNVVTNEDNKAKLKAVEEKNLVDTKHIQKLQNYVRKQKEQTKEMKERLKSNQLKVQQMIQGFAEISEHQNSAYERYCTMKYELQDMRDQVETLKKKYDSLKCLKDNYLTKFNEVQGTVKQLQEEKNMIDLQSNRQAAENLSHIELCEQKLKEAELEKSEMEILIKNECEKIKKESEIRSNLEKELTELNNKCKDLTLEKENIVKSNESAVQKLQKEINVKVDEISTIKLRNDHFAKQLLELEANIKDVEDEIEKRNQSLINKDEQIENLNITLVNLEAEHENKDKELAIIQSKIEEIKERMTILNINLTTTPEKHCKEAEQLNNLKENLEKESKAIAELRNQIEQQKIINKENTDKINTLEQRLKDVKSNKEKLSTELNKQKELQNSKYTEESNLVDKIISLESELEQTKKDNKMLMAENNKYLLNKKKLLNKLHKEIDGLKKKIDKDKLQIDKLNTEKVCLKSENEELNKNYNESETKFKNMEAEAITTEIWIGDLKREHDNLKKELKQYDLDFKTVSGEKKKLEETMDSINLEQQELLNTLNKQLHDLTEKNDDLKKNTLKINELRNHLKEKEKDLQKVNNQLFEITSEGDTFKKVEEELHELKNKLTNSNQELSRKNVENREIQKELTKLRKSLKEYKLLVEKLEKGYKDMKDSQMTDGLGTKSSQEMKLNNESKAFQSKSTVENLKSSLSKKSHQFSPLNVNVYDFNKESMVDSPFNEIQEMNIQHKYNKIPVNVDKENDMVLSLIDNTIKELKNTSLEKNLSNLKLNTSQCQKNEEKQSQLSCEEKQPTQSISQTISQKSEENDEINANRKQILKTNKFIKSAPKNVRFSSPLISGKTTSRKFLNK